MQVLFKDCLYDIFIQYVQPLATVYVGNGQMDIKSSCDLGKGVKVTKKHTELLYFALINPCQFNGNPPTDSA